MKKCCSPILKMADPAGLRRWHQKVLRHEDRLKNGAKTRAPADPDTDNILHNAQFGKFANLYCKVFINKLEYNRTLGKCRIIIKNVKNIQMIECSFE